MNQKEFDTTVLINFFHEAKHFVKSEMEISTPDQVIDKIKNCNQCRMHDLILQDRLNFLGVFQMTIFKRQTDSLNSKSILCTL